MDLISSAVEKIIYDYRRVSLEFIIVKFINLFEICKSQG